MVSGLPRPNFRCDSARVASHQNAVLTPHFWVPASAWEPPSLKVWSTRTTRSFGADFLPFSSCQTYELVGRPGSGSGWRRSLLDQDCLQTWRGELDARQTCAIVNCMSLAAVLLCSSQQKSPEPDGSVAVNEEGEGRCSYKGGGTSLSSCCCHGEGV